MSRSGNYISAKLISAAILIFALSVVMFNAEPLCAQSKRPSAADINAYLNSDLLAGTPRRGSKVDVTGTGFFTDFTDNVRVTKDVPELQLSDTQSGGHLWRLMSGSSPSGSFNVYDNNAGAYRLTIDGSGNVGIGTTSPTSKISIGDTASVVNAAGSKIAIYDNGTTFYGIGLTNYSSKYGVGLFTNGNFTADPRLVVNEDGNVGIGTRSPAARLTVAAAGGDAAIQMQFSSTYGQTRLYAGYDSGTLSNNYLAFRVNQTAGTDTEMMRVRGDGNVGIGTTSPQQRLSVNYNTSNAFPGISVSETNASASTGLTVNNTDTSGNSGILFNIADANKGRIKVDNAGLMTLSGSGLGANLTINSSGNIGIGTTSPANALQVSLGATNNSVVASFGNTARADAVRVTIDPSSNGLIQLRQGAGTIGTVLTSSGDSYFNGGKVGIGTTSPADALQVSLGATNNSVVASFGNTARADAVRVTIDPSSNGLIQLRQGAGTIGTVLTSSGDSYFNGGKLGIGRTDPAYTLDVTGDSRVTGNINLTGTINAKYQDVAEWVPASERLSAGTVVVLDSTKSNQVTSSTVSYDTRVAGVVSEQPGIALGEKSDNKVLVATTGRVLVKVDASKGPIHIGDLLVTSDIPGVAMKSEPVEFAGRKMHMPGTLIGKALEPLDKGTGAILVLLSLQ